MDLKDHVSPQSTWPAISIDEFFFEKTMPRFDTGIVPTVPLATHAGRHLRRRQAVPIGLHRLLTAPIGMVHDASGRLIPCHGLVERLEDQVLGHALAHGTVEEPFHPLPGEGDLHAACEHIEGESAGLQRIVAIPDEISGGFRKPHPGPRMAMSQNTLVAGNHRLDHRLGHLRPQPKLYPQGPISVRVQHSLLEVVRRVNNSRDIIASLPIGLDGLPKQRFLLWARI